MVKKDFKNWKTDYVVTKLTFQYDNEEGIKKNDVNATNMQPGFNPLIVTVMRFKVQNSLYFHTNIPAPSSPQTNFESAYSDGLVVVEESTETCHSLLGNDENQFRWVGPTHASHMNNIQIYEMSFDSSFWYLKSMVGNVRGTSCV